VNRLARADAELRSAARYSPPKGRFACTDAAFSLFRPGPDAGSGAERQPEVFRSVVISSRPLPSSSDPTAAEPAPDRRACGCWRGFYAGLLIDFAGPEMRLWARIWLPWSIWSRLRALLLVSAELVDLLPLVGL
jgi:hypothetical protein